MNVITATRTYATVANAKQALVKAGVDLNNDRWLIAVADDGKRFVPTLVGIQYTHFAFKGIMVIN